MEGDDSIRDFIRVHCKEEKYKQRRDLPAEEYPHFVFHLHPPVVIQNLLPFEIFIDSLVSKLQVLYVQNYLPFLLSHSL
jgi:hypothetical protein